jgi:pimeloyl-ACP methyl ester carboxylesterase
VYDAGGEELKKIKKILLGGALAGITIVLAVCGFHTLIFYSDLILHPKRQDLKDIPIAWKVKAFNPREIGLAYEELSIKTKDGITLKGWCLPAPSRKGIILVHGFAGNRLKMIKYCRFLSAAGYNLVLFDLRCFGESLGNICSFGYYEQEDIKAMADFLKSRGIRDIGILAESMGAAVSLFAMQDCPDIKAAVFDSPFANLREVIMYRGKNDKKLNRRLMELILFVSEMRAHYKIDWVVPENIAENVIQPLLIIYGTQDKKIPREHPLRIFEKVKSPEKSIWKTESGHTGSFDDNPEEYKRRVLAFFEKYLK